MAFFQNLPEAPQANRPFIYARGPRPTNLQHLDEQWCSAVFLPIFARAQAILRDYPFDCVVHPEYLVRTHGLNPLVLIYSVRRCLDASDLLLKALLTTGARVSRLYWSRPEDDPRNGGSTFDEGHPMTQALIAVCPTPCWCPEDAEKPAWRWLDEWAWTLGNLRRRLVGVHDRMWQALWPYHLVLQARHAVWVTLFRNDAAPCYAPPSPTVVPRDAHPSDELVQDLRDWIEARIGNIEGLRAVGHLRYAMHGVEPRTAIQEGDGLPVAPKTRDKYLLADSSPAAWRCWRWMLLILQRDPPLGLLSAPTWRPLRTSQQCCCPASIAKSAPASCTGGAEL